MKVLCVVLLAFLASSTAVNVERCKAVRAKTSTLRCGDKVYSRSAAVIEAFNGCVEEGTDLSTLEAVCYYQKIGAINAAGAVDLEKYEAVLKESFTDPVHVQAIIAGFAECLKGDDLSDPYALIACGSKLYEKVCRHKSCDWINSD